MKKLIIAAAMVCVAAFAQATTVTWGLASGNALDTTKFASGTAYLILASDIAKPSLADDAAATTWYKANSSSFASSALDTGTIAEGTFSKTDSYTSGSGTYWLLFVNDKADQIAVATTTKRLTLTTSSMSAAASWTSSGMKTYAISVPEPTSALLLVLGMAGLALRRRRA